MSWPVSAPKCVERGFVVVAVGPRVDGHDQAVLHGHPRHLVHHVGFEVVAVLRGGPARAGAVEQFRRVAGVELERCGRADAVVGGDRAVVHEVAAPVLQRGEVAGIAGGAVARCRDEPVHVRGPVGVRDVQVGVRAEGGQDAAVERGVLGDRLVAGQVVQGVVRGGEDLDVEVLEELAGTEPGLEQAGRNRIVAGIGRLGADLLPGGRRRCRTGCGASIRRPCPRTAARPCRTRARRSGSPVQRFWSPAAGPAERRWRGSAG